MKIAYENHVAFTERITYAVGDNCDPMGIEKSYEPQAKVRKIMENGRIYLLMGDEKYDIFGSRIR